MIIVRVELLSAVTGQTTDLAMIGASPTVRPHGLRPCASDQLLPEVGVRSSSVVITSHDRRAIRSVFANDRGHQGTIQEGAIRVAGRVVRDASDQAFSGFGGLTGVLNFPARPPINLDAEVCHRYLPIVRERFRKVNPRFKSSFDRGADA